MTVYVCSLSASPDQLIQPGTYTLLTFPFEEDQLDYQLMHQPAQPDGFAATSCDPRSGLIWPSCEGWGSLTAEFSWEPGGYSEIRDQFVRDPLGLAGEPNATALVHRPLSPGWQIIGKHHEIMVHPGVPLGVQVWHNDTVPRKVTYAQFKLAIHPW
ncbi:hypothetical protein [Streptomyces tendae]|uniref:hypothetical protein n=1 Tax=Streptomyces tendae TaxID=1932 RepID=UPI003EBFD4DC